MNRKVKIFLENLELLYKGIEKFANKNNLTYEYKKIDLYEEYAGSYTTKEMYVTKNEEFIFKLKPIGAYIIGADGRVDLVGKLDTKILIFLEKPYFMEFKIFNEISKKPLYEGFDKKGWYFSLERKKIAAFNEKVLCEILEDVSEFECIREY